MTTLTDLLMRDPEHPEVRALLELRYRQVCAEQQLLAKLLHLAPPRTKRDRLVRTMQYDDTVERWVAVNDPPA